MSHRMLGVGSWLQDAVDNRDFPLWDGCSHSKDQGAALQGLLSGHDTEKSRTQRVGLGTRENSSL